MKIAVLGATGQIGHALTAVLARTHDVRVMVRNAGALRFPANVEVLERAEFTAEAFGEVLQDVDHVIYGIGPPEQFMFDQSVFERINVDLLNVFLKALAPTKVSGLTYLSTYEVFEIRDGVARESHPIVDESSLTAYSQSKVRAYRRILDFARESKVCVTTLHPAAVYGGLSTADGLSTYLDNILHWRVALLPFIPPSRFPAMHIDSLCDAIVRSFGKPGPFILSDAMTSLNELADLLSQNVKAYRPLVAPLWLVKTGVAVMEAFAKIAPVKPLISNVQVHFLTRGWEPVSDKAIAELGWTPMRLQDGVRRYALEVAPQGQVALRPPAAKLGLRGAA